MLPETRSMRRLDVWESQWTFQLIKEREFVALRPIDWLLLLLVMWLMCLNWRSIFDVNLRRSILEYGNAIFLANWWRNIWRRRWIFIHGWHTINGDRQWWTAVLLRRRSICVKWCFSSLDFRVRLCVHHGQNWHQKCAEHIFLQQKLCGEKEKKERKGKLRSVLQWEKRQNICDRQHYDVRAQFFHSALFFLLLH